MNNDLHATIERLANALQTVALLATQLRRQLGESAQDAIALEAAADKAVRAIRAAAARQPVVMMRRGVGCSAPADNPCGFYAHFQLTQNLLTRPRNLI